MDDPVVSLGKLAEAIAAQVGEALPEDYRVFLMVCHVDNEIPSTNGHCVADVKVGTNTDVPIEILLPLLEASVERARSILGERQPARFFDGNGADA